MLCNNGCGTSHVPRDGEVGMTATLLCSGGKLNIMYGNGHVKKMRGNEENTFRLLRDAGI